VHPIVRLLYSGAFSVHIAVLANGSTRIVHPSTRTTISLSAKMGIISKGKEKFHANLFCSSDYRRRLLGRMGNVEDQKR
jgi:hypothetical protein